MKRLILPVLLVAMAFAVGRSRVTSAQEENSAPAEPVARRFADYKIASARTQPELEVLVRGLVRDGWEPAGGVTLGEQYLQAMVRPAGRQNDDAADAPEQPSEAPDQPSPSPSQPAPEDPDGDDDFKPKTGKPPGKRTGGASRVDDSDKVDRGEK